MANERPLRLFGVVTESAIEQALVDVVRSGAIASGAIIEEFRVALGALLGNPNVVTTSDVSSAIRSALHLAGIGSGDEVITAPFTCLSTTSPVGLSGAKVVWADVDPSTGLLDVADLKRCITSRTKAVMLYHLAGYPGPVEEIARLCADVGLKLIEDCDNALGATVGGRLVGSFGDYAAYCFYPNRHLHTLDGGAIACRSAEDFERAMRLRWFGINLPRFRDGLGEINPDEDVTNLGWGMRLGNIGSAVGLAQLPGFNARLAKVRENAAALTALLKGVAGIEVVKPLPGTDPAYWGLLAHVANRDEALRRLKTQGVEVSKLHFRNDRYSAFNSDQRPMPGVEKFSASQLFLPCGWWLERADIIRMTRLIKNAMLEITAGATH